MTVAVQVLREVSDEAVAGLARLVGQPSPSATPLTADVLSRVVAFPANAVLVARIGTEIVGTLTLVTFPIPTGLRAWIEDVVVDETARGGGVGAELVGEAVRRATAAGARSVDLTSRPTRAAANRLYERQGFERRDSVVYRLRAVER